jgi:hypothetical protein
LKFCHTNGRKPRPQKIHSVHSLSSLNAAFITPLFSLFLSLPLPVSSVPSPLWRRSSLSFFLSRFPSLRSLRHYGAALLSPFFFVLAPCFLSCVPCLTDSDRFLSLGRGGTATLDFPSSCSWLSLCWLSRLSRNLSTLRTLASHLATCCPDLTPSVYLYPRVCASSPLVCSHVLRNFHFS